MPTIQGVVDNEIIQTAWGNSVATELNTHCVKKSGATMTGLLNAGGHVQLPAGTPTNVQAVRKDYLDIQLENVNDLVATKLSMTGGTVSGNLYVGGVPNPDTPVPGIGLLGNGSVTVVPAAAAPVTQPNMIIGRGGTPAANTGGQYIRFDRGASAIGTITIESASSVAYNKTSDPRLKERTGDVDDAAALVATLGAKAYRGRWIADEGGGREFVFLNSTDIEAVAPYAVRGDAGAVGPDGEIIPQQVDHSSLVPLLFAALSQALERIAVLEAGAA